MLAKNLYNGRKELSGAWNFGPREDSHLTVKDLLQRTFKYLETGSYVINRDFSKHEATLLKLDSSKAKQYLGWTSVLQAQDALKLTLGWYKNYYTGENVIEYTDRQIKDFFK